MSASQYSRIVRHEAPGEVRAALLDQTGRPCRLFLQRWDGADERARCGSSHSARLRSFSDGIQGAFLELDSGEEAFLRLKSRDGFTEGMKLVVSVMSEARSDKLARVRVVEKALEPEDAFLLWQSQIADGESLDCLDDRHTVDAAFEEALASSITLPNGGRLHIDRTRALTAFDVDTSGREGKGSAAAKALAINRVAISEAMRQMRLRGLGGNAVLDCIGPLNKHSSSVLHEVGSEALSAFDFPGGKVLAPSTIGMMQVSLPWTVAPLEDVLNENPAESDLLDLLRDVQREADAVSSSFFTVQLSKLSWQAYLDRKSETDAALNSFFSGRVSLMQSESEESRVQRA